MRSTLLLILSAALLSACANVPANSTSAEHDPNARPAWIDNPGKGAVGFAGFNVMGAVKQDETAIARARAEFANHEGVSVASKQNVITNVNNGQANTHMDGEIHVDTNQNNVQCQITEKWHDVPNNVMWVLCMPLK